MLEAGQDSFFKGSVEKISGRDPQETWHQYKLIGGKPPAVN
jgi:hypothetical protein